jgi:Ca2+/Na+ antiporter
VVALAGFGDASATIPIDGGTSNGGKLMALQMVWLVLGLALLVKVGEMFVSAAVRIAEFLRMPRVVIGSTLVSLATTTPELVV